MYTIFLYRHFRLFHQEKLFSQSSVMFRNLLHSPVKSSIIANRLNFKRLPGLQNNIVHTKTILQFDWFPKWVCFRIGIQKCDELILFLFVRGASKYMNIRLRELVQVPATAGEYARTIREPYWLRWPFPFGVLRPCLSTCRQLCSFLYSAFALHVSVEAMSEFFRDKLSLRKLPSSERASSLPPSLHSTRESRSKTSPVHRDHDVHIEASYFESIANTAFERDPTGLRTSDTTVYGIHEQDNIDNLSGWWWWWGFVPMEIL